jgi:large subunit ribosomal protein L4
MPRKALRVATRSAYLAKFQDGETVVVDQLAVAKPRTREMARALSELGVGRRCLIVIDAHNADLWKSCRNIPGVSMKPVADVNAYDLLSHATLLITRGALDLLVESMRSPARASSEGSTQEAAQAAETSD